VIFLYFILSRNVISSQYSQTDCKTDAHADINIMIF